MWFATITSTEVNTVTVAQSNGNTPLDLFLLEYSGVASMNPLDASTGQLAPSASNAMSTGAITTSGSDLIVTLFEDSDGSGIIEPGAEWTPRARNTDFYAMVEDNVPAPVPPGTYDPAATLPSGTSDICWLGVTAAFRTNQ
jgi:hypothetical protein